MASEGWYERVAETIRHLPKRTLVVCARQSGIEMAVRRLHAVDLPLISIWINENDGLLEVGTRLAEAVTAGLGTGLFGKNLPFSHGLKRLLDFQTRVGPLRFVFGWATGNEELLHELMEHVTPDSPLLVISDQRLSTQVSGGLKEHGPEFLRLTQTEAALEARGLLADSKVAELAAQAEGKFGLFRSLLIEQIANESPEAEDFRSIVEDSLDHLPVASMFEALVRLKRWEGAFELACARAPHLLDGVIHDICNHYFNRGAHEYVWARLTRLSPDLRRTDKIAYWLAKSALATNRYDEQAKSVRDLLLHEEAPELRALAATTSASGNMLSETSRAVARLRSVATLRAHGLALALNGQTEEPSRIFREALQLADQDSAHHLVVACGVDLAEFEIRRGRYASAVEWARWALDEYVGRGLTEKLRFMSARSVLAFAYLLGGELAKARELADGARTALGFATDAPGFEAVVATVADVALVSGETALAARLYRQNHARASLEQHCATAIDIVIALLAQGRKEKAKGVADRAYALSRSSSVHERTLGDVAIGIAYAHDEPVRAERVLIDAMASLRASADELHAAQAAIWLALIRLGAGRRKAAGDALRSATFGLQELGDSGWALLSGRSPMLPELVRLWRQTEGEFEFRFLGARTFSNGVKEQSISVRNAELLAILAIFPDGLHGEKLHALLYGDCERNSTLKSTVSRARKLIPIASSPYAIDAAFKADFIELQGLLACGELQRALNLYRGSLLPAAEAPAIVELREHIDEAVRTAVLHSQDPDALIHLGNLLDDDLEIWEQARECLPYRDHRHPVVSARITRIKAAWAL